MSQLSLIIKHEFLTDIRSKSFWIGTLVVPVIIIAFSVIFGFLASESDTLMKATEKLNTTPDPEEMTMAKVAGMLMGMFLTVFVMIYGA